MSSMIADELIDLIEQGWIPCGTSINTDGEVLQTFYLPLEEKEE